MSQRAREIERRVLARESAGAVPLDDWSIPGPGLGGGGAGGLGTLAKITSRIGTAPPYVYTALAVTPNNDGTNSDGTTEYDPVYSVDEDGAAGGGACPLQVGDVVLMATSNRCMRKRDGATYA